MRKTIPGLALSWIVSGSACRQSKLLNDCLLIECLHGFLDCTKLCLLCGQVKFWPNLPWRLQGRWQNKEKRVGKNLYLLLNTSTQSCQIPCGVQALRVYWGSSLDIRTSLLYWDAQGEAKGQYKAISEEEFWGEKLKTIIWDKCGTWNQSWSKRGGARWRQSRSGSKLPDILWHLVWR